MISNPKAEKGTFILRCEFYPQIQLLTRAQRGDLLLAIFAYAAGDKPPKLDDVTGMCFEFIRSTMDFFAKKYEAICAQNQANGKKGGRPKKVVKEPESERFFENPTDSEKSDRFFSDENEKDEKNRSVIQKTGRLSDAKKSTVVNQAFEEKRSQANESEKSDRLISKPKKAVVSEKTEITPSPSPSPFSPPKTPSYPTPPPTPTCDGTHTVDDKKGGYRGKTNDGPENSDKQVEARELIEWIADNVPTVAGMAEPLTEQHAIWILRKYSTETARRIIKAMHNKRAFLNMNAYTTFTNFARVDKKQNAPTATEPAQAKRYTWDEVLDYVNRHSGKATTDDFDRQVIDGVPVWFKKSDLQTQQLAQG